MRFPRSFVLFLAMFEIEEYRKPRSSTNRDLSDSSWESRCRYWAAKADALPPRKRRERRTEPLILTGHGLSARVDKGCLLIRHGNTHYPAEKREHRFFRGGLDIPPRIIALDGSGTLTLDALDWMAEQGVVFVRINYDGSQSIVISPSGYTADADRITWQRKTRDNPKRQLEFAIRTIAKKLKASAETLVDFVPISPAREKALVVAKACAEELKSCRSLSGMLGIEGKAAQFYWLAWYPLQMNWKSQSCYPIPDEWRSFRSRSSILNNMKHRNLHASSPVNAMLNYAYAVLLSEARIRAVADGYDPMLGVLHDQRTKRKELTPSFALDLMEPLRPVVDRAILKLVAEETFSGADFVLQRDGVCRLNSELARLTATRVCRALAEDRSAVIGQAVATGLQSRES